MGKHMCTRAVNKLRKKLHIMLLSTNASPCPLHMSPPPLSLSFPPPPSCEYIDGYPVPLASV